jgi:hypothetical protein
MLIGTEPVSVDLSSSDAYFVKDFDRDAYLKQMISSITTVSRPLQKFAVRMGSYSNSLCGKGGDLGRVDRGWIRCRR